MLSSAVMPLVNALEFHYRRATGSSIFDLVAPTILPTLDQASNDAELATDSLDSENQVWREAVRLTVSHAPGRDPVWIMSAATSRHSTDIDLCAYAANEIVLRKLAAYAQCGFGTSLLFDMALALSTFELLRLIRMLRWARQAVESLLANGYTVSHTPPQAEFVDNARRIGMALDYHHHRLKTTEWLEETQ